MSAQPDDDLTVGVESIPIDDIERFEQTVPLHDEPEEGGQ